MDKKEFYKEIMSQYTFDENKIRRNAKRSSSVSFLDRHGRWLPLTSAAAVFVAVFGGYMILSPMLNRAPDSVYTEPMSYSAGPLTDTPASDAGISDARRLEEMEKLISLYNSNKLGSEMKVMYITFRQPMTYGEFTLMLDTMISDTGIIRVESVWDGAFISAADAKIKYASYLPGENADTYKAARIQAPADLYSKLLEVFEFVDCSDIVNDENFEPMNTTDDANIIKEPVKNSEPAQTTAPVTEITDKTDSVTAANTTPADTTAANTTTSNITTADTSAADITQTPDTTAVSETSKTDETTPPSITNPDVTETEDIGALNPINISATLIIPADGVYDVEFINDDHFIILEKDTVALYQIISADGKMYYKEIAVCDIYSPKITYRNTESKTLIIMGSDSYNRRVKLFAAGDGALTEIDTSAIPQDASVTYAFCNGDKLLVKAQSLDSNFFYTAERDSAGEYRLGRVQDIPKSQPTAVVSFDGTSFVYASKTADTGETDSYQIFNYIYGDLTAYYMDIGIDLTGSFSFVRSPDLSNFAVNSIDTGEAWIWNAERGELSVKLHTVITKFSDYDSGIFTDGISWYRLDGLDIEVISEAEAATFSVKTDFSNKYKVFEVTPDAVKIEVK